MQQVQHMQAVLLLLLLPLQVNLAHRGNAALSAKLPALVRRLADAHMAAGEAQPQTVRSSWFHGGKAAEPAKLSSINAAVARRCRCENVAIRCAPQSSASRITSWEPRYSDAFPSRSTLTCTCALVAAGQLEDAEVALREVLGFDLSLAEKLPVLALLADVQLKEDSVETQAKVAAKLAEKIKEAGGDASKVGGSRRGLEQLHIVGY